MTSPRNPLRSRLPGGAGLSLALAGALALAGCGGAASSPAPTVAPSVPAPTTAPAPTEAPSSEPAATSAAGGDTCGVDVAAIKAHIGGSAIDTIEVIGGCHMLFIATTLAPTDIKAGVAICDKAAEVAYDTGLSSITVAAADAKELAIGLESMTCIGEP